ncbi:MAG: hypothetical protein II817_01330 [Bacteroidales bacterium]|nr:hypothetical protein [Bacteroidales bacterium]
MSSYPNCPRCGKNDDVKQLGLKTSASFRIARLHVGAVIMDLTTPIGKGASVDSARRLRTEARMRELQDYRYHCNACGVDFEYNKS